MSARPVLSTTLAVLLGLGGSAFAMPTVDAAKGPESKLPWQSQAKFSTLHGDEGYQSRWQGWGSFDEARNILAFALRNNVGYSAEQRGRALLDACRQAINACGDAAKYRRLVEILAKSADACTNWTDTANALHAGVDFLVNGSGGPSLCQGILSMGLSMTRGQMTSYENAFKIQFSVVSEAMVEAQTENVQWYSILAFTKTGADQCKQWSNGYLVMERIAYTVASAQPNQTVYCLSLSAIAQSQINSAEDLYKVLREGFRVYERDCPARTHKLLAGWLVTCSDKIRTWTEAKELLVRAAAKMENLSFDAPAAKVMLQAGLDLSSGYGSAESQYIIAHEAGLRVRSLDVPASISSILDMALRSAESCGSYYQAVETLRRAFGDLLRM
jgi:hypothetical protein